MRSLYQHPPPLPSICPQEPILPFEGEQMPTHDEVVHEQSQSTEDKISRAVRVVAKKQLAKIIRPNIIKTKRQGIETYQQIEHKRQLQSMKKRIQECKNWEQRKKNHNDPIAYPIYLIREENNTKDINIDGFCQKVLNQSKFSKKGKKQFTFRTKLKQINPELNPSPSKQLSSKPFYSSRKFESDKKKNYSEVIHPTYRKRMRNTSVFPSYLPQREKIKKLKHQPQPLNLPKCSIEPLLYHIYEDQILSDNDLRVLKSRMEHFYGVKKVKKVWDKVMKVMDKNVI